MLHSLSQGVIILSRAMEHHATIPLPHPRAAVPITPWLAWLLWHHDVGLASWHHGTGLALWHHGVGLALQHHGMGLGLHCHVAAPLVQPCIQHKIPLALGPYILPARSRHPGQHSTDHSSLASPWCTPSPWPDTSGAESTEHCAVDGLLNDSLLSLLPSDTSHH